MGYSMIVDEFGNATYEETSENVGVIEEMPTLEPQQTLEQRMATIETKVDTVETKVQVIEEVLIG